MLTMIHDFFVISLQIGLLYLLHVGLGVSARRFTIMVMMLIVMVKNKQEAYRELSWILKMRKDFKRRLDHVTLGTCIKVDGLS